MLQFEKFTLDNGLRVIVHKDTATPMVAMNILFDVGARDEEVARTGFAHLFEHLMFGGSVNIPEYDEPLQMAGGENNAYTTNDITNYYIQLPLKNMETAFWLESDRMLSLAFSEKSLDVQRKVVSEEFKEHYLNKPYGNAWHELRTLAYTTHPYQWPTIGKNLEQIETAQLADVKAFFFKHYRPQNAVMCVAGNVTLEQVRELSQKWFGDIPAGDKYTRNIVAEPKQEVDRTLTVNADVPLDALYKAWHMAGRLTAPYYATDLITEIMGSGFSSRLYQRLVKEQQLFSNINCYHTGSLDPGLVVIEGKIREGKTIEAANEAVEREIALLVAEGVTESELQKAKNKIEAMISFEDMTLLNRANNLAFYELLGDAEMINKEWDHYKAVTAEYLQETARDIFRAGNCNTMFYLKKQAEVVAAP
ncbi:peptidase M16 [Flavipsychrobacter stenotrophus]|uniref:Peptidase M16 n=1 Tax=Flavipsychrobacter stenotrophus TaxID=2077091 RepID=A0A2S7SZX2_9BACT|nr:pitrilysin family protein [Flavipsychrobacter stenotrophus]PQJ12167.1 peptidase M16 [Flavipsychrobacter stenotrophus]